MRVYQMHFVRLIGFIVGHLEVFESGQVSTAWQKKKTNIGRLMIYSGSKS